MKLLLLTLLAMVLCVCAATALSEAASSFKSSVTDYENNAAVNTFRDYIRINTSQPSEGNANYDEAVVFWKIQAASLGLNATVFEYYPGKPIVVITWEGTNTSLPSIMLNSHMDVVAVDESVWSHPPFAAEMDSDGNIYGRGTQDMKSVGIQYLEAIRRLMADNVTLARTIHMSMVPDEEIGGAQGMQAFLKSDDFAALNVGFVMDEGIPYTNSSYKVFYADRTPWQIVITCTGPAGHGSLMLEDTAADKFRNIINLFLDFRTKQMAYIKANPDKDPGLVTSINLTKVSGGLAMNIIPGTMSASFDIRIAPGTNETQFNETVSSWIRDAGGDDCSHHYVRYESIAPATILDNNVYWTAFKQAADEMKMDYKVAVCPATSDMIHMRSLGIPAIGFAPIHYTQTRMHGVDEYLNAGELLSGVDIYFNILKKLANIG